MRWTRVRRRAISFVAGQAQGWVSLQANIRSARTTGVTRLSSTTFEGWYEVPRRSLAAMARGRPSRVVLAPFWGALSLREGVILQLQATVATKANHRGERGATVKTIAQGGPVAPPVPVVTCARTLSLRARLWVQCAPGLPAPSSIRGSKTRSKTRTNGVARMRAYARIGCLKIRSTISSVIP